MQVDIELSGVAVASVVGHGWRSWRIVVVAVVLGRKE